MDKLVVGLGGRIENKNKVMLVYSTTTTTTTTTTVGCPWLLNELQQQQVEGAGYCVASRSRSPFRFVSFRFASLFFFRRTP